MARGFRSGQPPEQLAHAGRRRGRAWKRLRPGTGLWGPSDQSSAETENQKAFGSREQEKKRRQGHERGSWARLSATNENDSVRVSEPTPHQGLWRHQAAPLWGSPWFPEQELRCRGPRPAPSPLAARGLGTRASQTFRVRAGLQPLPARRVEGKAAPCPGGFSAGSS